jgi:2-dehydropantoate 2-reductase
MAKGRRTEIQYLKGFGIRERLPVEIEARASARPDDIINCVEHGEEDPYHITELPLN